MIIGCPHCKTRFKLSDDKIGEQGVKLRCTKCSTLFQVVRHADISTPATSGSQDGRKISVLMAHESPAFCSTVAKVLAAEQIELTAYNDGRLAYEAIQLNRPDVVLLDVALPSMYGFEICEEMRKVEALAQIKIILIASIYDKTRYKRCPQSLYGADDYIEKHHIPDDLATKIYRLVTDQKQCEIAPPPQSEDIAVTTDTPTVTGQDWDAQEETRRDLQLVEKQETVPTHDIEADGRTEAHLKARKLARIIASDIALYNQAKVEEGVKTGRFYELLAADISEGRQLFEQRVSADVLNDEPYLDDAFDELIQKLEKELGL